MTRLIRVGLSRTFLCVLLPFFAAPARAADTPVFEKTVLPLLWAKCVRSKAALVKGGESGPAVVPGSPEKSQLRVKVAADKMPPDRDKLSEFEKAVVRAWIDAGVKASSGPLEESIVRASFFDERGQFTGQPATARDAPPRQLTPFFKPPDEFSGKFGDYKSPLKFDDGRAVKSAAEWPKRRQEILKTWHEIMGPWPELIEKPKVEYLDKEKRDGLTQHHLRLEIAPQLTTDDAYLLMPEGKGPFPAVLVVFYDAKTGVGQGKAERCDFALRLAKRGFVTLSLGSAPATFYPSKEKAQLQPLSFHAYVAANCHTILANLPEVDAKRVGVMGHSYGGKWAMFAACLYDKFACGAWSDPGIVFDEKRSNVNYWEPWYLGYEPGRERKPGIPTKANPRTGAYKRLVEAGHDLHELHALMTPRPFLVSGGSEDGPERWRALNHAVAVSELLGAKNRVAMTNRKGHAPTDESNEQLDRFFEYALKQGQPAAPAKEK